MKTAEEAVDLICSPHTSNIRHDNLSIGSIPGCSTCVSIIRDFRPCVRITPFSKVLLQLQHNKDSKRIRSAFGFSIRKCRERLETYHVW
jgi:hypothetical protein